jgi:methylmalonyl-CoA mutase N-terminal domain/subunit
VEREEAAVVGVNRFATEEASPVIPAPDYSALAAGQRARVAEARRTRDAGRVGKALGALKEAARDPGARRMPVILECVRARGTVGEISDVLRSVWGQYGRG